MEFVKHFHVFVKKMNNQGFAYCTAIMDAQIVDVSAIFWPLIEAIIILPYDDLLRTRFYEIMERCVNDQIPFRLRVCGCDIIHDNVNSLFYGTRDVLANMGATSQLVLLDAAIKKIEEIIMIQDATDDLNNLSVTSTSDPNVAALDDLLAQLVI